MSQNASLLICLILVAAIQHSSASNGPQFKDESIEKKKVECFDEVPDDPPSRCCRKMHKFVELKKVKPCKRLANDKVENKPSVCVISQGSVKKPMHLLLKKEDRKRQSGRLYPNQTSASQVAEYEAKILAKLNNDNMIKPYLYFPKFVDKWQYSCFTVIITNEMGTALDEEGGNQWRKGPIIKGSRFSDLMKDVIGAFMVLQKRNIKHNNISPSSISCLKRQRTCMLSEFREHAVPNRLFPPWRDCIVAENMTDEWYAGLTLLTIGLYGMNETFIRANVCKERPVDSCNEKFFANIKSVLNKKFGEDKIAENPNLYISEYVRNALLLMCYPDPEEAIWQLSYLTDLKNPRYDV